MSTELNKWSAPSQSELKRLLTVAEDGLIVGWIIDLQESLSEMADQASQMHSDFEHLKEKLLRGKTELSSKTRRKVGETLKQIIAFNNRSQKEKDAFDAVGVGDCAYDVDTQLGAVRKAISLIEKQSK
jgi:hypothetical protein